ncbi:hypothetical protein C2E23DRAFT_803773 [Lenzites betulinus]|nr:hypothetical protein C2E23DRAFT_803773 [Lenzites betulinus]
MGIRTVTGIRSIMGIPLLDMAGIRYPFLLVCCGHLLLFAGISLCSRWALFSFPTCLLTSRVSLILKYVPPWLSLIILMSFCLSTFTFIVYPHVLRGRQCVGNFVDVVVRVQGAPPEAYFR